MIKYLLSLLLLSSSLICFSQEKSEKFAFTFSYGFAHDFLANEPSAFEEIDFLRIDRQDVSSSFYEFSFTHRIKQSKSEIGLGFAKQVHTNVVFISERFPNNIRFTLTEFRLRDVKNFYQIHYKYHLLQDQLIINSGAYFIKGFRPAIELNYDTEGNVRVDFAEDYKRPSIGDFGIWIGLDYFFDLGNIALGATSKAYYSGVIAKRWESWTISPTVRFKF